MDKLTNFHGQSMYVDYTLLALFFVACLLGTYYSTEYSCTVPVACVPGVLKRTG